MDNPSESFGFLRIQVASDSFRVQGCEGPDHAAAVRKELQAGLSGLGPIGPDSKAGCRAEEESVFPECVAKGSRLTLGVWG